MKDSGTVTRSVERFSPGTLDETTLEYTPDAPTVIYSGKCYIAPSGLQARGDQAGGFEASQKTYMLSIPYDAAELKPGDVFTADVSTMDPTLSGKTFQIRDVTMGTAVVWRQANMTLLETSVG